MLFHQCCILIMILISLIIRTSGRSLETLKQRSALSDIGEHWTEKYFYDFLVFRGLCSFFSVSEVLHIPKIAYCFPQASELTDIRLMIGVRILLSVPRCHVSVKWAACHHGAASSCRWSRRPRGKYSSCK